MTSIEIYVLLAIFLPLLSALLTQLFFKLEKLRNFLNAVSLVVSLIIIAVLFSRLPIKPVISLKFLTKEARPLFFVDSIALILGFLFIFVGLIVLLYSFWYMKGLEHLREFYFTLMLLITSVVGAVFASHLVLIYLFWETAAIATWRLVGYYRTEEPQKASSKAFLILFFGSSLMVAAMAVIYGGYGSLNLIELNKAFFSSSVVILTLFAIAAKSAIMPLHTWLEEAYPAAPIPVNAFLSAAVEKLGLILFLRLFVLTGHISHSWLIFIGYLAVFTSIVAGGVALVEKDVKKILAASTISQLSFILIGFITCKIIGVIGALLYIVSHSLAKSGLFLATGIIERQTGERELQRLGGLMKGFPVTAMGFALLALSIAGVPPLIGFASKLMVVLSVINFNVAIAALAIAAALFTLLYMYRLYNGIFAGESSGASRETGLAPYYVLLLGVISLIIGILPAIPVNIIQKAVGG